MIKLGDKIKYIDLTGVESEGEVVYLDEFNYVTKHNFLHYFLESQEINSIFGRNKINESFTEDTYMIHNKPLKEIDKKYREDVKQIRKVVKGWRVYEDIQFLVKTKLDNKPLLVNVIELKKLYKSAKITRKYL